MSLPKWRETTVRVIAEKLGPVANPVVDDILSELGLREQDMTMSHYRQFLQLLYNKLPVSLNRHQLCRLAQVAVLRAYDPEIGR